MKSTLRVLIPALLLVWAQANDKEAECKGLKKTIHPDQLHAVEGSWVLVWAVSDGPNGQTLIPNITSQHLTLHLLDSKTVHYDENNFYRAQKWNCSHFVLNATVVDGNDEDDFKLESDGGIAQFEGKEGPIPDNVTLSFYPSCPHCLDMVYRSNNWDNFLLIYSE
uniref:Uncharacterized protein n=1 Tax=Neogobius melanostomus TaxID=47308 RepID=A0A8C6WRD5_9GOBI